MFDMKRTLTSEDFESMFPELYSILGKDRVDEHGVTRNTLGAAELDCAPYTIPSPYQRTSFFGQETRGRDLYLMGQKGEVLGKSRHAVSCSLNGACRSETMEEVLRRVAEKPSFAVAVDYRHLTSQVGTSSRIVENKAVVYLLAK